MSREVRLLRESLNLLLLVCPRAFKLLLVLLLLPQLLLALHLLLEAAHRPLPHRVQTDPTDLAR